MIPLGIIAILWAIDYFPLEKVSLSLAASSIVTVFFSSYMRIQLPRLNTFTRFPRLIISSLIIYGGEVAFDGEHDRLIQR